MTNLAIFISLARSLDKGLSVLRASLQNKNSTHFALLCVWSGVMLRNVCPVVARAAGRLTASARRPAPSTFAAAAISRPFSSEELVPGVGKGKTSTGLVSALNFGPGFCTFQTVGRGGYVCTEGRIDRPFLTSRPSSLFICMHMCSARMFRFMRVPVGRPSRGP